MRVDLLQDAKSALEKEKSMNKLDMKINMGADDKLAALEKLFPGIINEKIVGYNNDGSPRVEKAIDICKLQSEMGMEVITEKEERYHFSWPGKKDTFKLINSSTTNTLRPSISESCGRDGENEGFDSKNIYIEGDNLDVLQLLQETYINKIKMIYIDPPYNTGSDFVYDDDYSVSLKDYMANTKQIDEYGNRLKKNIESNGRFHTEWLNMIYPRLKLARTLLEEQGLIFISIDDNEICNLRKICDEVFGDKNFINCFIWNCSTAGGIRPKFVSKTHEYVLCYAKNKENIPMLFAPLSESAIKTYTQKNENGAYRDKDFVFKNKSTNINQKYYITCPDGEKVKPKDGYIYRFVKSKFEEALEKGDVTFKKTVTGPLVNDLGEQAHWNIYIKKYLGDAMGAPSSLIPKEMASIYNVGTQHVQKVFDGKRIFENVKPVDLISYFVKMATSNDDIILDFFSGSGTTAEAVLETNNKDDMQRRFIMVQLQEQVAHNSEAYKNGYVNICEIGKERIRRISKNEHYKKGIDRGFRVLKLDSSNMKDVYYNPAEIQQSLFSEYTDNIKEDRTPEDLLFQVMLDLGVLLSSKIEELEIAGKKVFNVSEGFLVACFDNDVTDETVKAVAKMKPYYAVFRDSCMSSDSVATNFEQIFMTYSPETVRKVL